MAAHLTEDEQVESIKRWWADNGKSTVVGVLLVVGGYFGWGAWQDKQQADAEAASVIFQNLSQAVVQQPGQSLSAEKITTAQSLATELKDNYPSSLYASQAALFKARLAVEQGELAVAAEELQWVIDKNVDAGVTLIARARLARVLLAQQQYDQALAAVPDQGSGSFKSAFAEIRGDIYVSRNEPAKARPEYEQAMLSLLPDQMDRSALLQIKMDDLDTSGDAGGNSPADQTSADNTPAEITPEINLDQNEEPAKEEPAAPAEAPVEAEEPAEVNS